MDMAFLEIEKAKIPKFDKKPQNLGKKRGLGDTGDNMLYDIIGAKYGGAGGASAPPALSDRSAGGARMYKMVQILILFQGRTQFTKSMLL